jgi:hypothetical protein
MDLSCTRNAQSPNNEESCGEDGDEQNNSDSASGGGDELGIDAMGDTRHHHPNALHISNNVNPTEGHTLSSERLYLQRHYVDSNGTNYHHVNHQNQQTLSGDRVRYARSSQHRTSDSSQHLSPLSSLHQAAQSLTFHHHLPPGLTAEQFNHYQHHHHHHQQGTDASAMKEYAENTMKELLSIYGLNSPDMAENITKNVPIANFSSGEC